MEYTQIENKRSARYPFFTNAMKYGYIAGGGIALCLFTLQKMEMGSIGMKYLTYVLLGIVLAVGLSEYDKYLQTGTTFRKGMVFAAQITLFTGVTLVLIDIITYLIGSDLAFSKYGLEATNFGELLLVSGGLFLEIMVSGLVFTFIILQYLKSRVDYNG